ncbi:MAG: tRNA (guanosine(37)-N1)-methyltransferase TrmD [Nitrospirae bacterium]|nr:tRNA (guanosine(37)-N1)-methyltransferase TrmD [Nitrospirota bacterium]
MRFDVLTLFPGMFRSYLDESILSRAQARGLIEVAFRNIRDYSTDKHHTVDDAPYGGGAGMVLMPDPVVAAIEAVERERPGGHVILLTPCGRLLRQERARELAMMPHLVLICGRYEGVDERVAGGYAREELSIGDYVLCGGELPALVVIEAVARLVPGVLGAEEAAAKDSFAGGLLEHPQYTRPREFRGTAVPDVLLGGDHARIARWRREQSLLRTARVRPDLLAQSNLTDEEVAFLGKQGYVVGPWKKG